MRKLTLLITIIIFSNTVFSQSKYWIFFTDKNSTEFNPFEYFDLKAIERYSKMNLSLYDSTNYPVNENYLTKVSEIAEEVTSQTRWFNAVAVWATEAQISEIIQLDFVKKTQPIYLETFTTSTDYDTSLSIYEDELLFKQLNRMNGFEFVDNNFDGKGIRIAIFDAGFPKVDEIPVFEHIRNENRIIATYDFTKKKEDVYDYNAHGTMVMSCIAGKIGDKQIGLATGAEFLLARTEVEAEPFSEEENWLAAAEWADKNGADIINSSLGYTYHRYFTYQMDGQTSLVVHAANMAATKGMLVVNAMGNDGDNDWKIVGTPADADSILSIGGINPDTDYHTSFSSFGPTVDKRLKPNIVAYGHAIVATKTGLEESQGTSFSTPLISGFAACAWQTNRNLTNMELMSEIQKSGDLYPYFDYAHGYGVPQADYFTDTENEETEVTEKFTFEIDGNYLKIKVKDEFIDKKNADANNYLYYHIQNIDGYLDKYWLIDVYQSDAANISFDDLSKGSTVRATFKGYTANYIVE